MSLFTFLGDFRGVRVELRRIADALDRIAPLPTPPGPEVPESEAVTYVDDEKMAIEEAINELGPDARRRWEAIQKENGLIPEDSEEEPSTPQP